MPVHLLLVAALFAGGPQDHRHREEAGRFECPEAADLGDESREALARDLAGPLSERITDDELSETARLFFEHEFTLDQTVNQLVSAYCPAIARDVSLNTFEKTGKVQAFAARAYDVASAEAPVADPNRW
ncbi:hypothetical protein [Brevundimonas sp.]|uniref:hypothetical protein n=1 Tax=Brevundimonas sp. TaxID=1871086 RepID=UPI0028A13FFA|nr:hypothetical protein [Brevundimonas sp.]